MVRVMPDELRSLLRLNGRSCKDEIYRVGVGAGYCKGNLNFATVSEEDEVYNKKKVSRRLFSAVDIA
ncbi:hairy/enhancer-of-split related with YRPW motif-like protein isoform X3 [Vespula maculifrons]|uniref:Hairy/enhancer-of-split related with YRPW motif-like protein isoform X3 n=1 Tax=Vespula maculifrons TaxID=7453 RepID=A0ABD2B6R7_VESMC